MGAGRSSERATGRGGGWVAAQAVLILVLVVVGIVAPEWPAGVGRTPAIVGAVSALAGLVLAAAGIRHLGPSLTPFPTPIEGGELRDGGVYGLVRHPIYGGGLLAALGWSLLMSPWALVPTALLAVLFEGKRRREEGWLEERYPGYVAYRRAVPRRFIPFVI
jgi:protein-S-isoprenylcysteine O-methyltransferase Ste14